MQRWKFDPAGNRMPITGPSTAPTIGEAITGEHNETDQLRAQQRAQDKASPVSQAQLEHSDYNALQGKETPGKQDLHATQKWAGNRVAYYENSEDASSEGAKINYRYDSRGNRTQSLDDKTGRKMQLAYDKGNQLVQVIVQEEGKHLTQSYRYDAFGRRLAKYNDPNNIGKVEESGTDYFGWDGDRLIHTERFNERNTTDSQGTPQPEVIHTVYEPGSFTPLVQLRQTSKAKPDMADELLAQIPQEIARDALRSMLSDISVTNTLINERIGGLGVPADAQSYIKAQLQQLEETVHSQRQESAKAVEMRFYLCDHLGTPNALLNNVGMAEWAAQLDAWGDVKEVLNKKDLYQPIGLPGQHRDHEVRLSYNNARYYIVSEGSYINSDPIGLRGGMNTYEYSLNSPVDVSDPTGLFPPLLIIAALAALGGVTGGGANYVKQKYIDKKCKINKMDVANGVFWGAAGGAAMPIMGATTLGAMTIGGATGFGQYASGSVINGESMSLRDAAINAGMGAIGAGVGGTFANKMPHIPKSSLFVNPYLDAKLPQHLYEGALKETLSANLSAKTIGQGAAGAQLGNQTEIPCLTCKPKCE